MTSPPSVNDPLVDRFRERLSAWSELSGREFENMDADEWLEFNAELGRALRDLQRAGQAISKRFGVDSASARMGRYLLANLGTPVSNYELAGVAGVLEWARRVRELGLEKGWDIASGPSAGMRVGEYRLDDDQLDLVEAESWRLRNSIRRQPGSGISRCLSYLRAVYPEAASKEDLEYVARIQQWSRRMRELEEQGWAVVSSIDDPRLPPGSYRLDSDQQGPARQREAIAKRFKLLERDGWRCQLCGANRESSPGTVLQIHHRHHVRHGGDNDDDNLITLCAACHAGVHATHEHLVRDELLEPGFDPDL